ncbi:MAG: hypothetical protein LC130_03500 [Bryobacterales bacterium]|nr:hypothetical protein [Bryobacterales bacterium]
MEHKGELFYVDKDGNKQDAELHEEILNNPEADLAVSLMAYESAVAGGMEESLARELYIPDLD